MIGPASLACSFGHFNALRLHQGLDQRIPTGTPQRFCADASNVVTVPTPGGLHHGYRAGA